MNGPRSPQCQQPHGLGCDGTAPEDLLVLPCSCPCHDPDDIPF